MLVSGGQILAIDHVVKNDTLVGDGSITPLGVNTDVIATTALVSATSAKLQEEINDVSGKFNDYYTKNETSAASAISAALVGVIRHETAVSAADDTIDVSSATLQDGTVVYKIKATSNTNIIGIDPISAELREDGTWYITYHGTQGNIYNKGPNIDIYQVDDQWYISAAVPDVSNFLTSADGHEGKALVLKDNVWVPADEANGDIITINTYSSVSSFVDAHSGDIINTVNTYSSYSAFYNNTVNTVSSYSAYWNEVSSFSSHSGEFMHPSKLEYAPGTDVITGYDGSAFGDKDTNYVGIDGIKVNKDTFEIGISANFLSASDKYLSANALDDLSGKWESVYDTVYANSGTWNAHSALSATKLDASESAKFMKIADLQSAPENTISGYGESAFYYPPFPEIPEYSGKNGIKVENYEISISADYLSANALDELSGKWEDTANTVSTASGGWNEASAFAANSGKFVTSAGFEFENNLAYFLKKQEDESMAWSGVDLSDLGKMYSMSSLTPSRILATISAVDENTSAYVISAAPAETYNAPEMEGDGCLAELNHNTQKYNVGVNIVGNKGISADYDAANNQWNVGISANSLAYMYDTYNQGYADLPTNSVIKFSDANANGITVDEDGFISLPARGGKFTFCFNEYIDNNKPGGHAFLLNKLILSANTPEALVTTQNYYSTEVGASNATIAITVDHSVNSERKYALVYAGNTIPLSADINITMSILEEAVALDQSTRSGGSDYTGVKPIDVGNDTRKISLRYDTDIFTLTENQELTLNAAGQGGDTPIDPETFYKLLNSVNGRIVETIPIGNVNSHLQINANYALSYLFRPIIEFDMSPSTVARVISTNASENLTHVQVAVYYANEEDNKLELCWWSERHLCTSSKGTHRLEANAGCTDTVTIYPEKLYYVLLITFDQAFDTIGFANSFTSDAGIFDVAYGHSFNANFNPTSLHMSPVTLYQNPLGETANGTLKPYVGFRNEN